MDKKITINTLTKKFGDKVILNNLNFTINEGEFLSILGPSGCGKTTLLRILIGIEKEDSGHILKGSTDLSGMDPIERGMGIVFQNYALFPNMSVLENVSYPLKINGRKKQEALEQSTKMLESLGMTDHLTKRPYQLSGGQQQRVAIARTLVLNPDIILLDEPMSALDAATRLTLRDELKKIQKDFNITMVYVTHDQEDAFSMSDRILVMNKGEISQLDTPIEIFNHPANDYIKEFVIYHLEKKMSLFTDILNGGKQ